MTPTGPRRRSDDTPAWWSSDASGVDPDEDPLAAHLAARGLRAVEEPDDPSSGPHDPDDLSDPPDSNDSEDGGAGSGASARAGDPPGEETVGGDHPPGICGVCPICRGHALLRERHPEVADHLADAARSLSAALASFADLVEAEPRRDHPGADHSRAGRPAADHSRAARRRPDDFRPITLDDDEDGTR